MDIVGWIIIVALFIVGMAGAVYPVLPGALAIYFAFFVYGWFFSFAPYNVWFWIIQTLIVVALFVADYAVTAWGSNDLEARVCPRFLVPSGLLSALLLFRCLV